MELGTATASPGELATGYLDVTDLPTGTPERIPVVIAEGVEDGPTVWVTASIHGDEHTGMATAHDVMADSLPEHLAGTVVCLPVLNPAGLRRTTRTSYYHDDDPNRFFPDREADVSRPPRVQEVINRRLFEAFAESADVLVDHHTAQVGSVPFLIRDRVLYGGQDGSDDESTHAGGRLQTQPDAEALAEELNTLVEAASLPVVTEYAAEEYTQQNLQRSVAGAALNEAGIPAFTVELGSPTVVEEDNRELGVRVVYDVLLELGALDAVPDGVDAAARQFESPVPFPVKRYSGPHTDTAGLVRHCVAAGDVVEAGQVIADVVSPHGESIGTVATEEDGYVLGRRSGVAVYENDPVASLAIRDDGELVAPRTE